MVWFPILVKSVSWSACELPQKLNASTNKLFRNQWHITEENRTKEKSIPIVQTVMGNKMPSANSHLEGGSLSERIWRPWYPDLRPHTHGFLHNQGIYLWIAVDIHMLPLSMTARKGSELVGSELLDDWDQSWWLCDSP